MKLTKNFREAFEDNTDYSSITGKTVLRDEKTTGTIGYSVYGVSECGLGRSKNGDNIYLNGIYMKSFQFDSYSKNVQINGESALFAVAGYGKDGDWAKNVFGNLDHYYAKHLFLGRKTAEQFLNNYVFRSLSLPDMSASYGSLLVTRDGVAANTVGEAGVFLLKNGYLKDVCNGKKTQNFKCGTVSGEKEDTYILCSGGLLGIMNPENIAERMGQYADAEEGVKAIIERAKMLSPHTDVSIIVVQVKRNKAFSKKLVLKIAAIALAVAIAVGAGIAIYHHFTQKNSGTIQKSGVNISTKSEAEIAKENKEKLDAVEKEINKYKEDAEKYEKAEKDDAYRSLKNNNEYASLYQEFNECMKTFTTTLNGFSERIDEGKKITNVYTQREFVDKLVKDFEKDTGLRDDFNRVEQAAKKADEALQKINEKSNTTQNSSGTGKSGSASGSKNSKESSGTQNGSTTGSARHTMN